MVKIQQRELTTQKLVGQVKILELANQKQLVQQRELIIVNLKQKEKVGEKQRGLMQVNHQQQELILHLEVIQEAVQVEQIKVKVQVKVLLKILELLPQKM